MGNQLTRERREEALDERRVRALNPEGPDQSQHVMTTGGERAFRRARVVMHLIGQREDALAGGRTDFSGS
jgi:hypothetical protein